MKIKIDINNTKSIDRAIQQLENASNQISSVMFKEFLSRCCVKISQLANENLRNIDVGVNVKNDIENSWSVTVDNNGKAILSNHAQNAIYVEFGVGIVGASEPHPNALNTGWEYNLPSQYKYAGKFHDDDTWRFIKPTIDDIDLPQGEYEEWRLGSGKIKIITRGALGSMFVYNAIVEFVAGNHAKQIWADLKRKYWG